MDRRQILKTGLVLIATATAASIYRPANAKTFKGGEMWTSALTYRPKPITSSLRVFLSEREAVLLGAIQNRLIPGDELGIGAVDAGCVVFVDHQLAGAFGKGSSSYKLGPYKKGTPEQGNQSPLTPADVYQKGLAELDAYTQQHLGGSFEHLSAADQDEFLEKLEAGGISFTSVDSKTFFALMLQNVKEGYLADPVYGGNRDMVGWRMIGFPGARYDYRDYLPKIGQVIKIEPVSMLG